jgi:hypothetical protein
MSPRSAPMLVSLMVVMIVATSAVAGEYVDRPSHALYTRACDRCSQGNSPWKP